MSARIQHDHPSIESVRATIERAGSTAHPRLVLPEEPSLFPEGLIHVTLSESRYRGLLDHSFEGVPQLRSVYDNARLARSRDPDASNRLREWFATSDLEFGRSVHVDVIEPGHQYGIRVPGASAVYTPIEKPDDSLAAIAEDLE